jgi:tetratricopeptide (TPR) repeat protein/peroxiredoxin
MNRTLLGLIAAASLLQLSPAQEREATTGARAKVAEAKTAVAASDTAKAVALLKEAVELDPDLPEALDQFTRVATRDERIKACEAWARKFPDKPVFPSTLADAWEYDDYKKSEAYAKQAIAIDPKYAKAYMTLSLIADASGDQKARFAYLKQAADAQPDDPSWAFYYASAHESSDPVRYRTLMLEVSKRFPNTERGAQALYWLASNAPTAKESIRLSLMLKHDFPPEQFGWSMDRMTEFFELLMRTDPEQALALAKELSAAAPDDKTWTPLLEYAGSVVQAKKLLAEGKASEAATLLEGLKLPRQQNPTPYYLGLAAAQLGSGDAKKAYDTLLGQMSKLPTDDLKAALVKTGAVLGKNGKQVNDDLWSLLDSKARPAAELDTTRFGDEKKIRLADYRAKVVLLNFWYPFCGPCRGEFPFLQSILTKYQSKGLVIISPNVMPAQDALVLPYMNGMHFDFIPVHGSEEWAGTAYGARGYPSNYLIDQQGRIVYKPRVIRDADARRTLELQIDAVLEHAAK